MMSAIAINIKSILRHAHFIRLCVWSVNLRRGLSNASLHLRFVLMVHLSCHKLIDLCISPPLSPISHVEDEARVKSQEKKKKKNTSFSKKSSSYVLRVYFHDPIISESVYPSANFNLSIVRQRDEGNEGIKTNSRIVSYLSVDRLILRYYTVLVSSVSSAQFQNRLVVRYKSNATTLSSIR